MTIIYAWLLRYGAWWTEFFVILDQFLYFYLSNNPKNQNFEKMKKPPGDIITLHMCTINDNHTMYGSWDMEHVTDRISFHFGPFFALLPPNNLKNQKHDKQNWYWYEVWRTEFFVILDHFLSFHPPPPGDIIILHKCTKYHDHMVYCSIDMARNEFNYFSFWAIFCPFTSLTAQKIKN